MYTTGAERIVDTRLSVAARAGNLLCVCPCPVVVPVAAATLSAQKNVEGVSMMMAPTFFSKLPFAGERKYEGNEETVAIKEVREDG